jgi:hypothetical protein
VKDTATLLPDRWTEQQRQQAEAAGTAGRDAVEFTLDLTTAAVIRVEHMNKQNDALMVDDMAQVVVPPPRSLSVALVSSGNPFIEQMVNALGLEKPAVLSPEEYEAKVKSAEGLSNDVIIFDRHPPASLPAVGNFVFIGCLPPTGPVKQTTDPAGVPVFAKDVTVLDWKRDHPLVRGLNMRRIFAAEMMRIELPVDAETIVEGVGAPLVALHRTGRTTSVFIPFDVVQSNWPLLETFPYFFFNTMQFLALGSEMDVREGFAAGATPRIPRVALSRLGTSASSLSLIGPDGSSRTVTPPAAGDVVLPPLERVGLHRVDPPLPQYDRFAVNLLSATESNIVPNQIPPGNIGKVADTADAKRRVDWWWWLVAAVALPLMMIEWWVYARKVNL